MIVLNPAEWIQHDLGRRTEGIKRAKDISLRTEKELNGRTTGICTQLFWWGSEPQHHTVDDREYSGVSQSPRQVDLSRRRDVEKESALNKKFALIEVPSRVLGRFLSYLPADSEQDIILLEDVIRVQPAWYLFHSLDMNNTSPIFLKWPGMLRSISTMTSLLTSFSASKKGLRNRRKGKPVRFVYDHEMDPGLLEYLIRRFNLNKTG